MNSQLRGDQGDPRTEPNRGRLAAVGEVGLLTQADVGAELNELISRVEGEEQVGVADQGFGSSRGDGHLRIRDVTALLQGHQAVVQRSLEGHELEAVERTGADERITDRKHGRMTRPLMRTRSSSV